MITENNVDQKKENLDSMVFDCVNKEFNRKEMNLLASISCRNSRFIVLSFLGRNDEADVQLTYFLAFVLYLTLDL